MTDPLTGTFSALGGWYLGGGYPGESVHIAVPPRNRAGGFIGWVDWGRRLSLLVRTTQAGAAAVPDAPPWADLYASDGTLALEVELPAVDAGGLTGLFGRTVRLGGDRALGRYTVVYRWAVGGLAGGLVEFFDLRPGDAAGAVISLHAHDRPEARYVLAQLDGGQLVQGRNPRF